MNNVGDVRAFIKKYFSKTTNTLRYYGSGKGPKELCNIVEHCVVRGFEAPDGYIIDGDVVYIVEHFEFDCFKATSKGSAYKRENAKIDRAIAKLIPNEEYTSFSFDYAEKCAYKYYIANLIRNYETHVKRVEEYKKNLINGGVCTINACFKVIFLVEDVSPIGSQVYDDEGHMFIINPANDKLFLNYLSTNTGVDFIIAASEAYPENNTWLIDTAELDDYKREACDNSMMHFFDGQVHTIGFTMLLPRK